MTLLILTNPRRRLVTGSADLREVWSCSWFLFLQFNKGQMPPKAKAAGKGKAPAKRKLAEEFPPGEVLTDTSKKSWKVGEPVGQGGFGLLYLANEDASKAVGADAPYVIKVEPSDNGPLFAELKFYMRAAKPDLIGTWVKSRKLKYLGVPKYWGSGLHEKGGNRYRFMVMDRFGTDLQKKFEQSGRRFPRKLVLQLGLRLLDILEYIHEHEYVHADIKASNLLLSHHNPNQVYLVDYGLAYRFSPGGVLKEYKEDPKRCHDGTIEFTSIDAHKGVSPSRRGDLEILAYCMVQWLCGRLPWEDKLQDPLYVRDSKLRCRDNVRAFLKSCFSPNPEPEEMVKFMQEVTSLSYTDTPDYQKLRVILQQGLKSFGATDDDKLNFPVSAAAVEPPTVKTLKRKKAAVVNRTSDDDDDDDEEDESPVKKRRTPQKKATGVKGPAGKKSSPRKSPVKRPVARKTAMKRSLVEASTQTSPMVGVKRGRGRAKKAA